MDVIASYEFPVPIWVTRSALEQSYPTGYRGVEFTVATPRESSPAGAAPLIDGVDHFESSTDGEQTVWDMEYGAFIPESLRPATALHRVAIHQVTAPEPPEHRSWASEADQLGWVIQAWFDDVRTWVEVITGQDLDPNHRVYDAVIIGAGLEFITPKLKGALGMQLTTPRVLPIPADAWRKVLEHVRDGVRPPLVEELCRDARAAERRGFYRRTAIDSAAALEMALEQILTAEVDQLPMGQQKRVHEGPSGLGVWLSIAKESGRKFAVPHDRLVEVKAKRNDAVHHGVVPNPDEACRVVQTVIDFLGAHGPSPRSGDPGPDGSEWQIVSE